MLPLYWYEPANEKAAQSGFASMVAMPMTPRPTVMWLDGITDVALTNFRKALCGCDHHQGGDFLLLLRGCCTLPSIESERIDLKKVLPRIPYTPDFRADFELAGRSAAALHLTMR